MDKSESIKNIATALVKFQTLVSKIKKGSNNPFFKSKYADLSDILDAIQQPLIESGLTVNQFPTGKNELTTMLIHADSGEYMMTTYEMSPVKNDPQSVGSCITYQRRYAIGAVLSLNIDDDDDGNKASQPGTQQQSSSPEKPWLNETDKDAWSKVVIALKGGKTINDIKTKWAISKANEAKLIEQSK